MTIVSTGYSYTPAYSDPHQWLNKTAFYNGILATLGTEHSTHSIERINYRGMIVHNHVQYSFFQKRENNLLFNHRIHRYIHSLQPDLVLINGFNDPLSLIRLRRKLHKTAKLVVIHRGDQPAKGYKRWLQRVAAGMVDRFIFTDAGQAGQWIEEGFFSSSKIWEVLPCSSTLGGNREEVSGGHHAGRASRPIFLWVGRLDHNKDPLVVLSAFDRYLQQVPGAKLYMIYQEGGLLEAVNHMISTHYRLKDAVVMVGRVEHEAMGQWYSLADFYISASHREACGIALLEAISCSCIPVVTNIPSFRKITGGGQYGLLFSPGKEEALYRSLLETGRLDKDLLRHHMKTYFDDHLSFNAIANKLNGYLKTLALS